MLPGLAWLCRRAKARRACCWSCRGAVGSGALPARSRWWRRWWTAAMMIRCPPRRPPSPSYSRAARRSSLAPAGELGGPGGGTGAAAAGSTATRLTQEAGTAADSTAGGTMSTVRRCDKLVMICRSSGSVGSRGPSTSSCAGERRAKTRGRALAMAATKAAGLEAVAESTPSPPRRAGWRT